MTLFQASRDDAARGLLEYANQAGSAGAEHPWYFFGKRGDKKGNTPSCAIFQKVSGVYQKTFGSCTDKLFGICEYINKAAKKN